MRKIIIILAILLTLNNILYANKTDALKKKQSEIKESIKAKKAEAVETKASITSVRKEIERLDREVRAQSEKLENLNSEIKGLQSSIDENINNIAEIEARIADKKDIFAKRIRAIYTMGDISYLSIILKSKDIHEALSNQAMTQILLEQDKKLIKYISDQKLEVERAKEALVRDKKALDVKKQEEEAANNALLAARQNKANSLAAKEKDLAQLEELTKAEEMESNKIEAAIRAEAQRAAQYQGSYTGGRIGWPLPGHTRITSPFGYRGREFHRGTDIGAPVGTAIVAAEEGKVIFSGWMGTYGQLVVISHGNNLSTAYAHCAKLLVSVGQVVKKGQQIATVGLTGRTTGPHLHFEVRVGGKVQNAMNWVR
ncbi:MAG: peptidoglycan DD-metalloendopeptidase family protein [Ezakiella sp.]|nr:peptidoglycan DD-metalloendopeptidase family protein [Ezakiella sp.]MDY3947101.1 peptidoglycan DD-metalloendopeptidase family protein [Ezakiella sp.]